MIDSQNINTSNEYTATDDPFALMQITLAALRHSKPNDRSELDRRFAIAITDCERLIGYFKTYVIEYVAPDSEHREPIL